MLYSGLLPLLSLACGPKEEDYVTVSEEDADTDTDADSDADSDTDTDTDTEPAYFEPAAVGFELYSGWNAEFGQLSDFTFDAGKTVFPPYVEVHFANLDFFGATDADIQAANDCIVYASFVFSNAKVEAYSYEDGFSLASWGGWEGYLEFDSGNFESTDKEGNCTNWDPSIFPGGDPVETFSGMHFGVAYGGLTDYLASAWTDTTIEDYGDSMFTQFIAVNHPAGDGYDFKAYDWTTGFLWEMDLDTAAVTVDDKGYLVLEDNFDRGGYTSGSAYWYEDFPNLDYSLLKEGVE